MAIGGSMCACRAPLPIVAVLVFDVRASGSGPTRKGRDDGTTYLDVDLVLLKRVHVE